MCHFSDHPWIREDGDAPDTPLDNAVLNRLKQFRAMNKFKKSCSQSKHLTFLFFFFIVLVTNTFSSTA